MPIPDPTPPPDQAAAPDLVAQLTAQLEQERNARQQAESQAQAAAAETTRARHVTEIALRYKLPTELANRLQGSTPAEIEADAKNLAASIARWPAAWSSDAPVAAPGLVSDPAPSSRANTLLDLVNGNRQSRPFRPSDD